MAKIINLETVQRIIDAQVEKARTYINDPSEHGIISRFLMTVNGPLTIWRCSEENRGTEPHEMAASLISCFAATLAAHIQTHVPAEKRELAVYSYCVDLEVKLQEYLARATADDSRYVAFVEREEIGVA